MKKVGIWLLVLTLLFLSACTPTVSPAPPSGDTNATTAGKTALGGKLPMPTTTTTAALVTDTVTLNGTPPTLTNAEWAMYNVPGTGREKPTDYAPSLLKYSAYLELEEKNGKIVLPDWLTDTALQSEINAYITAAEAELNALTKKTVRGSAVAVNGYLSVRMYAGSLTHTALYDLTVKKRIAFSDLFFKGVNYYDPMCEAMRRAIHNTHGVPDAYYEETPFYTFPQGHQNYTLDTIYWGSGMYAHHVGMSTFYPMSVLSIANDMQGMFKETVEVLCEWTMIPATVEWYRLSDGIGVALPRAETYGEAVHAAVKQCVQKRFSDRWSIEAIRKHYDEEINASYGNLFFLYEIGENWLMLYGNCSTSRVSPNIYETVLFDRNTGEEVPYTDLLVENWQEQARFVLENDDMVTKDGTAEDINGRFWARTDCEDGMLTLKLDVDADAEWQYCKIQLPTTCIKK